MCCWLSVYCTEPCLTSQVCAVFNKIFTRRPTRLNILSLSPFTLTKFVLTTVLFVHVIGLKRHGLFKYIFQGWSVIIAEVPVIFPVALTYAPVDPTKKYVKYYKSHIKIYVDYFSLIVVYS